MLSRNIRRATRKKNTPVEPKKERHHLRHPFLYIGSFVILVIITISFIGAPIISRMGSRANLSFGVYNGREILYLRNNYLADQYDRIATRIRDTQPEGTLESQLWQAWRYAFEQTVFHFAVLDIAGKSKIWISDDRVSDSLVESGPYTVRGVFDHKKYEATPRAERTAIRKLRRDVLTHTQYLEDLFLAPSFSSVEKEFIRDMARVERSFSFVSYDFADFPLEKALAYGLANRERFEKIKLSRITITASKSEAEKVHEMALAGQSTFADLARSYSKGFYADKGGDMDWQYYHQLEVLFYSEDPLLSIFNLKEGEISGIFESGSSWVFFHCDSEPVLTDFKEEEALNTVKDYVLSSEKGVVETHFMIEAEKLRERARQVGFDKACLETGLFPPKLTEYFPINYMEIFSQKRLLVKGEEDSSLFASAVNNEEFFLKLFSLEEEEISEPLLLSDDILVAVLLDERERSPEDLENLDPYIDYMASTSLESDIRTSIIDDDRLVDNFQEAFFKFIQPAQ